MSGIGDRNLIEKPVAKLQYWQSQGMERLTSKQQLMMICLMLFVYHSNIITAATS